MNRASKLAAVSLLLCISCGAHQTGRDSPATTGTSFDADINGRIVLVDASRNTLLLLSSDRSTIGAIGGAGWDNNQFDRPLGVWARNGIDIFVADYGNHRIQRFDPKLAYIATLSTRERANPDERFGYPTDVSISRLGDLFICDSENARILKVSGFSKIERSFGGFDAGKGRLKQPGQIEIGPNDNVYVQDGKRVVEFDTFGNFIREIADEFPATPHLYADDQGLGIVSGTLLYTFDRDGRLHKTVALDSLLRESAVHAFAFNRGSLLLLTDGGIIQTPDPR